LLLGEAYQDNNLVFCNEDGAPLDARAFVRRYERILDKTGLEKRAYHDLRYTYATLSRQEGVPVKMIQESLGHYSPAFTMQAYSHVTDKMGKDATSRIGNLLAPCVDG